MIIHDKNEEQFDILMTIFNRQRDKKKSISLMFRCTHEFNYMFPGGSAWIVQFKFNLSLVSALSKNNLC